MYIIFQSIYLDERSLACIRLNVEYGFGNAKLRHKPYYMYLGQVLILREFCGQSNLDWLCTLSLARLGLNSSLWFEFITYKSYTKYFHVFEMLQMKTPQKWCFERDIVT